jgi:hypothetical protein
MFYGKPLHVFFKGIFDLKNHDSFHRSGRRFGEFKKKTVNLKIEMPLFRSIFLMLPDISLLSFLSTSLAQG